MKLAKFLHHLIIYSVVVFLILPVKPGVAKEKQQEGIQGEISKRILAEMTTEEKIGQLFLANFTGSEIDSNKDIFELIVKYHIGGVMLSRENDNFTAIDTIISAKQLITDLQTLEWQNSLGTVIDPNTNLITTSEYIPLFIGISQAGGGYPNDQILNGLTSLPNLMSIGATWQPNLAFQAGEIAGMEFSTIGFNLFMGPSLDVLISSGTSGGGSLGANSFGGDPYWVGEMGREYINGLHVGSNNRMIVIANHFPGVGSSDRPSDEEVATVRKSLEQLKQIELAPFFEVSKLDPGNTASTDGLLVSHIRYQGFQGNIRSTTKPISFDPQALYQIMALSPLSDWRNNGGLLVSDDLGSNAVRLFYDPSNLAFSARTVARDAFLAGNDLLYLGNITSSDAEDNFTSIIQTLDFFIQKYNEDTAFAQRVDESVTRILEAKLRIFGEFSLYKVIPTTNIDSVGSSQETTFEIARLSATLINPDMLDLDAILPLPPQINDQLLFLTDDRIQKQCSDCPTESALGINALQEAILKLYGPQAGGLVLRSHLSSYSLNDIQGILKGGNEFPELEADLINAEWVIISIQDATKENSPVEILRKFLNERQDILRNKKVILFAFSAPYYLDATDISKLTAYYGLYCASTPFIEVAARLLFQELTPIGSVPVSVSGIGYDLLSATAPDPNQIINLMLDIPEDISLTPDSTPGATATPFIKVGDTISIKTGIILDHNGRPVPDGTGVQFTVTSSTEGVIVQVAETTTISGVARTSFGVKQPGLVEIKAIIEPSVTSVVLQLNITNEGFSITVVAPTPSPISATPTPEMTPTSLPPMPTPIELGYPGISGWLISLLIIAGICMLAYFIGTRYFSQRWGIRWVFCILLSGLGGYNFLGFGFPAGKKLIQAVGIQGLIGLVLLISLAGWGAGVIWSRLSMKNGNDKGSK